MTDIQSDVAGVNAKGLTCYTMLVLIASTQMEVVSATHDFMHYKVV